MLFRKRTRIWYRLCFTKSSPLQPGQRWRLLLSRHCLLSRCRPEIGDANLERFGAYALAGLLMALAYPRRLIPVALFVVGVATVLEVLQLVTPDRHGQFANAVVKAVGGIAGVTAAFIILRLTRADLDRLG